MIARPASSVVVAPTSVLRQNCPARKQLPALERMLHTCVLVALPPVVVLPPELLLPPPDEEDPPLVDVLPDEPPDELLDDPLDDEALGGFEQDSLTPTILKATFVDVLYVPADGLCEHTFQLEVCTTERCSSLASEYVTEATWWARASVTALARFHPP
ncbi:hypothetical protein ACWCPT_18985 [Streptomyces sp. NPDC002308]